MQYYIEITVLSTFDVSDCFLIKKLYNRIHICLSECSAYNVNLGLSFPGFKARHGIGNKIRVFGSKNELSRFLSILDLNNLDEYIDISKIRQVPEGVNSFAIFSRVCRTSQQKKAKKYSLRYNSEYSVELQRIKKIYDKRLKESAYVPLKSNSNGRNFSLFIRKIIVEDSKDGKFSTYGLSNTATVPLF